MFRKRRQYRELVNALLDEIEDWGDFACYKIPEGIPFSTEDWKKLECGECPGCRVNKALTDLKGA